MIQVTSDNCQKEQNFIKEIIKQNLPFEISDYGKLIRSRIGILLLKGFNLEITDDYLKILSAIELVHSASLLHDDVIDDEHVRRKTETVKSKLGNKLSILYGDLVLSNALKLITELSSVEMVKNFNETVQNMCEGEIIQNSLLYKIPTVEQYIQKTELKTASLFEFLIVALSVKSEGKIPFETREFGKNFGIAFQIKNDLENIKTSASDIENGVYTAPVIYSCGLDINEGAIEKTIGLIDNYSKRAIRNLEILKESIYKEELVGVAECLRR